ncbi:MAG TPA: c-type cytochrome [Burkholderiales bacterium]|jgi:sulfide dehydrogenase cytochrome subunit
MRAAILIVAALAACPAAAQDSQPGRNLAAGCAICHGTEGRSSTRELPSLAGLQKDYIIRQMADFRDGKRPATVMQQIARGYSSAEVEAMAAWFAAQKR